jgi:hypothetical protein
VKRSALIATSAWLAALTVACAALAQTPATAAPQVAAGAPPDGPSLQIASAQLRQAGTDLLLSLRFSRPIPTDQIDPGKGRFVCLVLAPLAPTARRICVSGSTGRLRATLTPIDADGFVSGSALALGRARVAVDGAVLSLRAPATTLRVKLGGTLAWRALVTWHDAGPCEQVHEPQPCTQVVPASGTTTLHTRAPPAPTFAANGHLRLLATGDSMIQIIDSFLRQRLERRRATSVTSDARISTGISKPFMLDWVAKAREQARSLHPDVTAISLGANDGFPMKTPRGASVACCGDGWVAEYTRRVAEMMRSYERGGRSLVYWMTLPAPRRGDFVPIYRAVNVAIKRAAAQVGGGARVIDLVPVFTPGGRFRQDVTFRGKTVNARQADGVHLSVAGASIAATLLIDRLRADHALPRPR